MAALHALASAAQSQHPYDPDKPRAMPLEVEAVCTHPKVRWCLPPDGRNLVAAHPPLQGKVRAVRECDWDGDFSVFQAQPGADYLTRATAAYPTRLNEVIAKAFVNEAILRREARAAKSGTQQAPRAAPGLVSVGRFGMALVRADHRRSRSRRQQPPGAVSTGYGAPGPH